MRDRNEHILSIVRSRETAPYKLAANRATCCHRLTPEPETITTTNNPLMLTRGERIILATMVGIAWTLINVRKKEVELSSSIDCLNLQTSSTFIPMKQRRHLTMTQQSLLTTKVLTATNSAYSRITPEETGSMVINHSS